MSCAASSNLQYQYTNEFDSLLEYVNHHDIYSIIDINDQSTQKLYTQWLDRSRRYISALQQHINQLQHDTTITHTVHPDIDHIYSKLIELHRLCLVEKLDQVKNNDNKQLSRFNVLYNDINTSLQQYITLYIQSHINYIRCTICIPLCSTIELQWNKIRDLPDILIQKYKITHCTSPISYYYIHLHHYYIQLNNTNNTTAISHTLIYNIYLNIVYSTMQQIHHIYLNLNVSRFNYRQYRVDLCTLLLIVRTLIQRCHESIDTAKQYTIQLHQLVGQCNEVCLNIALHIICITCPLPRLITLLQPNTTQLTPHMPSVYDILSKYMYCLWNQSITSTDSFGNMLQYEINEDTVLCSNYHQLCHTLLPHINTNNKLRLQLIQYINRRHELVDGDYPVLDEDTIKLVSQLKPLLHTKQNVVG